jgi:hypothetical protein
VEKSFADASVQMDYFRIFMPAQRSVGMLCIDWCIYKYLWLQVAAFAGREHSGKLLQEQF